MSRNPLLGLLAAILPAEEREALVRRGAEPLLWSALLGLVEFFVGGALIVSDALSWFQPPADPEAARIMAEQSREIASRAPANVGMMFWLVWIFSPSTWLLASVPLVGAARLMAFAISREVVGEPLVWAAFRIVHAVRRLFHGSQDRLRHGPERPDRLLREPGSDLVVLCARPKAEWNERVTIEIDERFYRLRRMEERQDGTWWAYAYLLKETSPNEIIRALVRYR